MARARNPLPKIRKIIDQWPETKEKISHGAPTWWGGKKTFATLHDSHHGDGRLALWIKSTADAQDDRGGQERQRLRERREERR